MNVEEFRMYCLSKKGTTESFPFDESTLVFKVMGKMFGLVPLESVEANANLKCDPEWSLELREKHIEIISGFHMSKKHWNTVSIDSSLSDDFIVKLIDHSYDLVVGKLTKKLKAELELY